MTVKQLFLQDLQVLISWGARASFSLRYLMREPRTESTVQRLLCAAMNIVPDQTKTVYRVWKRERDDYWEVNCIDMPMDYSSEGVTRVYESFEALPVWIQDRVRALRMLLMAPPTTWVDGVGRRITPDVYWVVE